MAIELLFMGTGTSAGVPMIGCDCDVCRSDDPRNHRTRPSVVVRYPGNTPHDNGPRQYLIDTAPDLRQQAVQNRIERLDGVLITHTHSDHVAGLDDLRRFNAVMKTPLDLYAEPTAMDRLAEIYYYIFEPHKNVNDSFVASLIQNRIEPGATLDLHGVRWTPLRLLHGRLPILGFRVDHPAPNTPPSNPDTPPVLSMAYCTDVSSIPPEAYPQLQELDVLVLDALRYRHHPTHLTVDQALKIIEDLRPKRAYLTHIAHDIDHAHLQPQLPKNVSLAHDGLIVN